MLAAVLVPLAACVVEPVDGDVASVEAETLGTGRRIAICHLADGAYEAMTINQCGWNGHRRHDGDCIQPEGVADCPAPGTAIDEDGMCPVIAHCPTCESAPGR